MRTMILLEFIKIKRRRFFLPILILAGVGLLWCTIIATKEINFSENNRNILVLINGLVIVNSMIFPLLMGVLCSRLIEIEHQRKMFRLLQTNNQTVLKLFFAKSLFALIVIFILGLFQVFYLLVMSAMNHFSLQPSLILFFFLSYFIASIFILLFQLSISLFIEKQSIGIVLGLGGSFIGLVSSGMLPKMIQLFLPWQYYALLNPVSRTILNNKYTYSSNPWSLLFMAAVILFIGIELFVIRKKIEEMEFC